MIMVIADRSNLHLSSSATERNSGRFVGAASMMGPCRRREDGTAHRKNLNMLAETGEHVLPLSRASPDPRPLELRLAECPRRGGHQVPARIRKLSVASLFISSMPLSIAT